MRVSRSHITLIGQWRSAAILIWARNVLKRRAWALTLAHALDTWAALGVLGGRATLVEVRRGARIFRVMVERGRQIQSGTRLQHLLGEGASLRRIQIFTRFIRGHWRRVLVTLGAQRERGDFVHAGCERVQVVLVISCLLLCSFELF